MAKASRWRVARDRAWVVVLAAFAAWPFVHNYLQRSHDFSPWKLFGYAMYTQPSEEWYVRVMDPRTEGATITLSADETRYQWLWGFRLSTFGLYTDPDPFAAYLLEVRPEYEALRVQFDEYRWRSHLSRYGVQTLIFDYYFNDEGELERKLSRDEVVFDEIVVPRDP